MSKKPVRLEKVEDKKPLWIYRLQIIQTILIFVLMIGLFILIAMLIGGAENASNWYNYHVQLLLLLITMLTYTLRGENMLKEESLLEIKDEKIKKCMTVTHDWYTFCKILRDELNFDQYQLWIGRIKWGDNAWEDVIAKYKKGYAWFQIGHVENQVDLVTAIIYSTFAVETIAIDLNNTIYETIEALTRFTDTDYSAIFGELAWKTDYDFINGVVGEGL